MREPDRSLEGVIVGGRFHVREALGSGAAGVVYAADDAVAGGAVALKVLHRDLYGRDDVARALAREANAAARVDHPHVVGVRAVGRDDGLRARFIAHELLDGRDVAGCLEELGSLSARSAIAIALSVLDGLAAVHAAGVVHRDVKPGNVFLHEPGDGRVVPKLIDFGVAQVRGEADDEAGFDGALFGTPAYMSPEQALGERRLDARADVWGVGVMLYEMLTGALPFGGGNPNAVMARIAHGRPTPIQQHLPSAAADLRDVVHRAIERDLGARYATAADFRAALARCTDWHDLSPEVARECLPRPSLIDGLRERLPAEFLAGAA